MSIKNLFETSPIETNATHSLQHSVNFNLSINSSHWPVMQPNVQKNNNSKLLKNEPNQVFQKTLHVKKMSSSQTNINQQDIKTASKNAYLTCKS